MLDPDDALEGLTSRQQLFASLSFAGLNDAQAYRQSGDCSRMTDATIGRLAHQMAHMPKVQAKLKQMRLRRDEQSTLSTSLTREWITDRLMKLARDAEKETVQLGALTQLGKIAGIDLFRETTRIERVERTPEEIDKELVAHLKALQPMIEGKANVTVEPEAADRRRKPRA